MLLTLEELRFELRKNLGKFPGIFLIIPLLCRPKIVSAIDVKTLRLKFKKKR